MKEYKHTNQLINETSPYLLQHAHNPVNWHPWKDELLEEALEQKKLLLISVGYSACHWCHVMEHESFEDEEVARIMNSNYFCIKVDREERPDVDQVYMNAVQVMTGMGGWPMNVVALPDGRPVWGGTYFRKEQWKDALQQIANLYKNKPEQLLDYAEKLENGLNQIQIIDPPGEVNDLHPDFFVQVLSRWEKHFDHKNGGIQGAPKFMMPNNYEFLMRYAYQTSNQELLDFVKLSLDKISWGGVFDQVDGGFSRYSVDERWHVPHFEKMLYDNAQLVQLYSKAYKMTKNDWYKEVVEKTLSFIQKELTDDSGAFYSALDADSENSQGENEEGAYYVWSKEELKELIDEDFELFSSFYNINSTGKWEEEKYVLFRNKSLEDLAETFNISLSELNKKKRFWNSILLEARTKRSKPGLDDKSLTSWNAMMVSGYVEAYNAFHNPDYLDEAIKSVQFILENLIHGKANLFHTYKNAKASINGYLEDYAFLIQALLDVYQCTFKKSYLEKAEELVVVVERNFSDPHSGLYFFKSQEDRSLITKTIEYNDNVIPASNSVMAKNLFKLGKLLGNEQYLEKAKKMLTNIQDKIPESPRYFSNWLDLMLDFTHPFYEIAITGNNFSNKAESFLKRYIPNSVICASGKESELPLLKNRFHPGKDLIYICKEGACNLPVTSVDEALKQVF